MQLGSRIPIGASLSAGCGRGSNYRARVAQFEVFVSYQAAILVYLLSHSNVCSQASPERSFSCFKRQRKPIRTGFERPSWYLWECLPPNTNKQLWLYSWFPFTIKTEYPPKIHAIPCLPEDERGPSSSPGATRGRQWSLGPPPGGSLETWLRHASALLVSLC